AGYGARGPVAARRLAHTPRCWPGTETARRRRVGPAGGLSHGTGRGAAYGARRARAAGLRRADPRAGPPHPDRPRARYERRRLALLAAGGAGMALGGRRAARRAIPDRGRRP